MNHASLASGRARSKLGRVAAVALLLVGTTLVASSVAFAASADCNGVFPGGTPADPIQKSADVSEAHPGDTITFTISWHSTATATSDVSDCFRVDDGSNDSLNAIVTDFNVLNDVTNQGDAGTLQTLKYEITVPSDPALLGHDIEDR